MSSETGGPAFPTARVTINGLDAQDGIECFGPGLSLRDYFAARAMPVVMQVFWNEPGTHASPIPHIVAKFAYEQADAMLKARSA